MFRTLAVLAAVSALPALAVPFTIGFQWTPVAGIAGNSADHFNFKFNDPSGQLKLSGLTVTLGSGMIYDLTNGGAGYLTWGAYNAVDGGTGISLGAALGEGTGGNKTATLSFTNFTNGETFRYSADVDETRSCGAFDAICRLNADSIAPAGFVERGAMDVMMTVDFLNGRPGQTFSFPASGQSWHAGLFHATTTYAGNVLEPSNVQTPEPTSWLMGIGGLTAVAFLRRSR
jgi:hypothetical protein